MSEKLLHVSMIVPQGGLYDLLIAVEAHKVANLEVRAVAQPLLALPPPSSTRRGPIRDAIWAATPPGRKFRVIEIAKETGLSKSAVSSQVTRDLGLKRIKRISYGLYVRNEGVTTNGRA